MSMQVTKNGYDRYGYGRTADSKTEIPEAPEKTQAQKNAEYLEALNKRFPELKMQIGNFIPTGSDRRISFTVDPALLEKMRSDPEQEKDTLELLKGAVQARKLIAALHKATGWEYEYSHDYIDANGKFWHTAKSVKKDPINEEMRKKTRGETEKRIDEAIKAARIKRKELIEMIKSDVSGSSDKPKNSDTLELSESARIAMSRQAEQPEEAGKTEETEEPERSGSADGGDDHESRCAVAVNVGKRMRMIAAAETPDQVRVVLELLQGDLEDCREGLENGWCDEEEVKKAEALIELANQRMAEVAGNEDKETYGVGAFEMSMLF